MDKQRKLDKLSKLAGLLLDNTITPTQAKQLVELLVNLNTKQKEDMVKTFGEMSDSFTQEAYTKLQEAVSSVSQKHADALLEVRQLTNKQRKEHEDRISELQTLLTEIKSIEVKDGENGKDAEVDYEKIIGSVLEQIPENVVETPEQVAGKLNTLEEVIDQKVIKGLTKKITDLSSNIAHSAVSKGAKLYTGTSETRVREIIAETPVSNSGGGTWGSITGTLSNQTDLQSALDAKQATLVSATNIKTINGSSVLGSGDLVVGGSGDAVVLSVAQTAHGFSVGDVIRMTSTANTYAKAQANSAANAEVVGIVSTVTDANNFIYTTHGKMTTGVPAVVAGTTLYLSAATAGLLTSTEPSTNGEISKPVAIVTQNATSMEVFNFRGAVVSTASVLDGTGTTNELPYWVDSNTLGSLAVATYPSLTELSYVKGVTSAIQTQINTKANSSGSLTQFVGNGNWKVGYTDGSGDWTELALGADGTFLKSNGAAAAPTFATPSTGSSIPKFMWTTDFSSTTRFNKQASGGTNTFNADGLTIDTSAGASSWAITRFDLGASWGGGSTFPVGSPSFSTRFYIVPIGSDVMMTFGIGQFITDIAGGTQTCTSEHIGFKITRTSSGTINLSATQADGSTENTTVLTTVASADELELIAQVNGSSSVDYYWRKNGGALSSATNLTSNMPTSAEAWICWGIQNNAVATQSTIYVFNGSFQR